MYDGKLNLAVIPARGGSKRVPRKNIRSVGGKPLIAYTIESALQSRHLDAVVVTSDDDEILEVAAEYGVKCLLRPENLALDSTPSIDTTLHAIERFPGFDQIVLLQPTSPLRTNLDIDSALEYCANHSASSCVSVCESKYSPSNMFEILENSGLRRFFKGESLSRHQLNPRYYIINGAIYISCTNILIETKKFINNDTIGYLMDQENSLDIDSELELEWFAFKLQCNPY
jgi:CMP-N,N'-diacetyllegionaminic acid synthase